MTNILLIYLIGALLAFGLGYSVESYFSRVQPQKKISARFVFCAALFSWLSVIAFIIGVLKGFGGKRI